jgi:hypothetical protein
MESNISFGSRTKPIVLSGSVVIESKEKLNTIEKSVDPESTN